MTHTCSGVVKNGLRENALKASISNRSPTPCIAVYVIFSLLDLLFSLKEKEFKIKILYESCTCHKKNGYQHYCEKLYC